MCTTACGWGLSPFTNGACASVKHRLTTGAEREVAFVEFENGFGPTGTVSRILRGGT